MTLYTSVLRPLLFRLPPETAHEAAKTMLRGAWPWRAMPGLTVDDPRLRTSLPGIALTNPVGLAPGLDKNADGLRGTQHLGFGYVSVGSLMPSVRTGNPKPRLMRLPDEETILHCYGLPSDGPDACVARLRAFAARPYATPVIATIDAPTHGKYLEMFAAFEPYADAVEVGLQCPNDRNDTGEFHEPAKFELLFTEIMSRRRKPVFVKLFPYDDAAGRDSRLELVERGIRLGIDGVTISGTFLQPAPSLSMGVGNTCGHLTFPKALRTVRDLFSVTRGRMAIKALGGISTGDEAFEMLTAGATTTELFSALIYQGWDVAARINRRLLALLDEHRIPNVSSIRAAAGGSQ